jgi:hypothetical protein
MQVKESVQIKQGFSKIQNNLHDMIKVLNLNQEATNILSVVRTYLFLSGLLIHLSKNLSHLIYMFFIDYLEVD